MLTRRIIPCLDVTAGRVVKGVNFVNLRDAGDPVELAAFYNEEGADELVFLDITASYEKRATMLDVVRRTAEQVFIPVTVGAIVDADGRLHSPRLVSATNAPTLVYAAFESLKDFSFGPGDAPSKYQVTVNFKPPKS